MLERLARPLGRRGLLSAGAALALLAVAGQTLAPSSASEAVPSLADRLAERTWAMTLPEGWLAAPMPAARSGDVVDLIAARTGDGSIEAVATGLRVMDVAPGALVVELTDADAARIAEVRALGYAILPILRSTR